MGFNMNNPHCRFIENGGVSNHKESTTPDGVEYERAQILLKKNLKITTNTSHQIHHDGHLEVEYTHL